MSKLWKKEKRDTREVGFPVCYLKCALDNWQIKGELYEHPEKKEQELSSNCASPIRHHVQYGPELPMQCSICRAGRKPIPAAQDRGWSETNPSPLQNLNVAPRASSLCPRGYWSPRIALKGVLACLEQWGIHLQPGRRKSTSVPFKAGWAATAIVFKKGRGMLLLTSPLLDLTASYSHMLLQRSGAPNTETWISAKDLVSYNYTEHSSI